MKRSTDRILTTHIGSLARPPELLELLNQRALDEAYDEALLDRSIKASIDDVVRRQVDAGITVINDGEQSKIGHSSYLKDRLSGFDVEKDVKLKPTFVHEAEDFPEYYARASTLANEKFRKTARRAYCAGPLGWKNFAEVERDIANMKAAAAASPGAEEVFMTAPSPTVAASSQANRYYENPDDYLYAMADVLRREYQAIVDAGFVLQVDCISFGSGSRTASAAATLEAAKREIEKNVEALNYALKGIPADMVRMHMCWGSDPGPHHRDGELKDMIEILLTANANGITLVGASGRHAHEWQVWKDVKIPDEKVIIAGVIDHTSSVIEHPDTVADRILRFASVIGRERVIAGVDCGFDPSAGIEELRVDRNIVWAKLQSLAQGAEIASKALWN